MAKTISSDTYSSHMPTRCYHSHKGLQIGQWHIYGGNSHTPVIQDADVYVSLQQGQTCGLAGDPWEDKRVVEIQFNIPDYGVPPAGQVDRFRKMITYLCNQLQAGKRVHVGCIGGHGRTGMVLSAVAAEMGEQDAIRFVRDNYCESAVESTEQVGFLVKHYGVKNVTPAKSCEPVSKSRKKSGFMLDDWQGSDALAGDDWPVSPVEQALYPVSKLRRKLPVVENQVTKAAKIPKGSSRMIRPLTSPRSIWAKSKQVKSLDK